MKRDYDEVLSEYGIASYDENTSNNNPVMAESSVMKWIPVSERLPEFHNDIREYIVYETLNNKTQHDYWVIPNDGREPFWNYYGEYVTHWMPLPAAPDGDK